VGIGPQGLEHRPAGCQDLIPADLLCRFASEQFIQAEKIISSCTPDAQLNKIRFFLFLVQIPLKGLDDLFQVFLNTFKKFVGFRHLIFLCSFNILISPVLHTCRKNFNTIKPPFPDPLHQRPVGTIFFIWEKALQNGHIEGAARRLPPWRAVFAITKPGCEAACCRLYFNRIKITARWTDMTAITERVLNDALALPPIERAELIQRLLQSFDESKDNHIDTAWTEEAESRIDAYEKGLLSASPAEEVLNRINRR
jgi:putative addiction module component (TIGR02574 family)